MKHLILPLVAGISLAAASTLATAADAPTLRSLGGASAPQQLDAAHTALLVIDFQNEYYTGKLKIPDGAAALANARQLVRMADANGIAVFHVQHVNPAGAPVFAEGSDGVKLLLDMQPGAGHALLKKTTVSVFASTDLDAQLKARGIQTVIVSGLMTHACVAAAAREAAPLGYQVIVPSDAVATRSVQAYDGQGVVNAAALHRAALTEIADAFGAVMPTAAVLALPVQH